MKRSGKIILAGALLVAAAVFILLAGCGAQTQLKTPQSLKIEDETLWWDEVDNAAGYIVEVDGTQYETEHNAFSVFTIALNSREYEFRVQAYGELRGKYENSEWSETLTYTPEIAQGWGVRLTKDGSSYEAGAYDKEQVSGKLVIPATYDGIPITRVVTEGFAECKNLTGVVLSSNISEILSRAFADCSALIRVLCPSAAELNSGAFTRCTALQRIILPSKLEELSTFIFEGCTSLTDISLPEGLKEIYSSAFGYCTALKKLEIPASVEYVSPLFLQGSSAMESLTVAEGNQTYRSEGNCIIRREDDALVAGCRASTIPESVKSIGNDAFCFCYGLTEITIPGNVVKIGQSAFNYCKDLRTVHIEEGVERIGREEGDLTYTIGEGVFANTALEELEIPASVKWIASGITASCQALKTITVAEGNQTYRSEGNCIIRRENAEVAGGCQTSVIPEGVPRIGEYAFYEQPIDRIELPEGIEEIGEGAFSRSKLSGIEFPTTLKTIGKRAFQQCTELKSVVFSNGLEEIGVSAFEESGLTESYIAIPQSVKKIGACAFYNCFRLSVTLPASVEQIGTGAFVGATVYTDSAKDLPEGWHRADPEMQSVGLDHNWQIICCIVYGCALDYEEGVPYVKSYTLLKKELTLHSGSIMVPDIIGGGILILVPQREGYVFKGWATEENGEIVCGVETKEGTTIGGGTYRVEITLDFDVLTYEMEHGTVLYAVWEKEEGASAF